MRSHAFPLATTTVYFLLLDESWVTVVTSPALVKHDPLSAAAANPTRARAAIASLVPYRLSVKEKEGGVRSFF